MSPASGKRYFPRALFLAADRAMRLGEYRCARRLFDCAARRGSREALLNLGYCHGAGLGTRKNPKREMDCYLRAWRRGEIMAANNIAVLCKERRQFSRALGWYRRGMLAGDMDAVVDWFELLSRRCAGRYCEEMVRKHLLEAASAIAITEDGRERALRFLALEGEMPR